MWHHCEICSILQGLVVFGMDKYRVLECKKFGLDYIVIERTETCGSPLLIDFKRKQYDSSGKVVGEKKIEMKLQR